MTRAEVKARVLRHITENGGVSYAELENVFASCGFDYTGELSSYSDKHDRVVFWYGWNLEAFTLIGELIKENKIERDPCHSIFYLIYGKALNMPVLQSMSDLRRSKRAYWLPCVFNTTRNKA